MKVFDIGTLIFTILVAVISFIAGEALLLSLGQYFHPILLMGIYFALIGIIIIMIFNIYIYKMSYLKAHIPSQSIFKRSILTFTVGILISMLLLGSLFQFLYTLGKNNFLAYDNYIIAIDNSSSMNGNDPTFARYDALEELFQLINSKQKLGVFVFSDDYTNVFPVKNIEPTDIKDFDLIFQDYKRSDGSTQAMHLLNGIADYLQDENIEGNTSIIFISDGECEVNHNILERLRLMNTPVNTVSVNGMGGFNSLHEISERTLGNDYSINDIHDLIGVFKGITNLRLDQLLVSYRGGSAANSLLFAGLRVLFIFLLACVIRLFQIFTIDISKIRISMIAQSLGFSLIAALLTELLFQNTEADESAIRFLMILFICLLVLPLLKSIITDLQLKRVSSFSGTETFDSSGKGFAIEDEKKQEHKVLK